MRSVFDEEDEEAPRAVAVERSTDRELTVSVTTLLGVFFGLVLVCALFFGLGYSLGRRTPAEANSLDAPASSRTADLGSSRPKPSAVSAEAAQAKPAATESAAIDSSAADGDSSQATSSPEKAPEVTPVNLPQPVPAAPPAQAALRPGYGAGAQALPAAATPASGAATTTGTGTNSGTIMVQIAAVSDQNDADVLLSALRKRGYSVSIRKEPGDALMHVQVGPFATRTDALAMRQKLLNDGYNAIVK
jgi:cell division septation protein DedD